ncbi:MAG: DUF2188 domain-containing protein [Acidimicrobiia bacterium]
MLLIVDVALVVIIALALWVAAWRGRARARRASRARVMPGAADLIPGRAVPVSDGRSRPRVVADAASSRATWSASAERGETAPSQEVTSPGADAPMPTSGVDRTTRPTVVVSPRDRSWVVRRDGASRASSVHASRDAAEARGRKTAQRERVVLEVRDKRAAVIDRTDYSAGRSATA